MALSNAERAVHTEYPLPPVRRSKDHANKYSLYISVMQ